MLYPLPPSLPSTPVVYSTDRFKAMVPVLVLFFIVYSTRRFVLCLALCYFVLVFFSPFNIAITTLGKEKASLCAFCAFVRFVLVWFYLFPLPLGVWEGLRFVIVAFPGLLPYLFLIQMGSRKMSFFFYFPNLRFSEMETTFNENNLGGLGWR